MIIKAKTPTQLTSLNLAGQKLKEIPREVFECTNLRKLNLSNNQLTKIPQEIGKLTKLEALNLDGNELKQLHAGLFKLTKLKTLVISNNSIKSLPHQFIHLENLQVLMMQNNIIPAIDSSLLSKRLRKLNISGNKINSIKWIANFPELRQLWISNLPIPYKIALEDTASVKMTGVKVYMKNKNDVEDITLPDSVPSLSQPRPDAKPVLSNPKVCISYSWDSENHKQWVLDLANKLTANGIHVFLDRYDLEPGSNSNRFMEEMLSKSEKALVILTPTYKEKAENRVAGAGYEYNIISSEILENQHNTKFIPIIRDGTSQTAVPSALKSKIAVYMQDDSEFEDKFEELCRTIVEKPKVKRPELGVIPDYD